MSDETLDSDLIGKIINKKYEIKSFIGKGGMGKVFLAKNIMLGNEWAIKVVSKNYQYAKYFRREAEILEKINHPNMPKIIDMFEDEENIYIVETYIEGKLLSDEILSKKRLTNEIVIDYFIQMSELIEYLHDIKPYPIVYRDLKPNNIIISHNNRLVLIDFSIAKLHNSSNAEDTIIAGNKYYSSPEQLNLNERSDTRSDIYALGMLALRMITGKLKQEISVYDMDGFNEISPELREIIEKCIYKNADLRYQSTSELVRDLKHLQNETTKISSNDKKIILVDGMNSSGKTFVASMLAKVYANEKVKTAYIDLTNELGSCEYFNIKTEENILDAAKENNIENIKSKSYKCKKYLDIYKGEIIDEKIIIDFARKLSKINDVVIIDMNENEYSTLYTYADEILLVLSQDEKIENLSNKKIVDYVDKELDLNNVKIIVNKYEKEFKNINEILKEINIIPKIFKHSSQFKEIYSIPEMPRKELLKLAKSKEMKLDDNSTTNALKDISTKIFKYKVTENIKSNFRDDRTVYELRTVIKFLRTRLYRAVRQNKGKAFE